MNDRRKTKAQLIQDLKDLRHRVASLDGSDNPDETGGLSSDQAEKVTERKPAEEALKESELWFRSMHNSLEEAVLVVTPDRILVNVNIAGQEMFGYSEDDLRGFSTEKLHIDHKHYLEFGRKIKAAFDKGEAANFEFLVKRKNGEVFPTEHTVSILMSDERRLGIISVVRDITERKQAEEELRTYRDHLKEMVVERTDKLLIANDRLQQEITERKQIEQALLLERNKLKSIFKVMDDGVYIVDQDYNFESLSINPMLKTELGPYKGRKCYEYFLHFEEPCSWCKNQDIFAGKTVQGEWHSIKNGRTYDLIDTPLRNADGSISKLEIMRDVTERKQVEEELRASNERFKRIASDAPIPIMIHAEDGEVLQISKSWTDITGFSHDEYLLLLTGQNEHMEIGWRMLEL